MLKVKQLNLLTEQSKNEKLDKYYRMREQDRVLQRFFHYDQMNELGNEVIYDYMQRKHDCFLDILKLLKQLGFPYDNLQTYCEDMAIGQLPKKYQDQDGRDGEEKKQQQLKASPRSLRAIQGNP